MLHFFSETTISAFSLTALSVLAMAFRHKGPAKIFGDGKMAMCFVSVVMASPVKFPCYPLLLVPGAHFIGAGARRFALRLAPWPGRLLPALRRQVA